MVDPITAAPPTQNGKGRALALQQRTAAPVAAPVAAPFPPSAARRRALPLPLAAAIFLGVGIMARLVLYGQNPDIWIDEAMLAVTLWSGSWSDIFHAHLLYDQSAPLGFLIVVKALGAVFGYAEYVLRLLPLLMGMALLPLGYIFARREFNERVAVVFLGLLVASDGLLFYTVHFKPYILEATLFMLYALAWSVWRRRIKRTARVPWRLIALGGAGILGATSMIWGFGVVGVALLIEQIQRRRGRLFFRQNWRQFTTLAAVIAGYYFLWLGQTPALKNGFMQEWWGPHWLSYTDFSNRISLLLIPLVSHFGAVTPWVKVNAAVALVGSGAGIYFLGREKKYALLALLGGLGAVAVTLYLSRLYPVGHPVFDEYFVLGVRMLVYLLPAVLLLVAHGAVGIFSHFGKRRLQTALVVALLLLTVWMNGKRLNAGGAIVPFRLPTLALNETLNSSVALVMDKFVEPYWLYYCTRNGVTQKWWGLQNGEVSRSPPPPVLAAQREALLTAPEELATIFAHAEQEQKSAVVFFMYVYALNRPWHEAITNYLQTQGLAAATTELTSTYVCLIAVNLAAAPE